MATGMARMATLSLIGIRLSIFLITRSLPKEKARCGPWVIGGAVAMCSQIARLGFL